MAAKEKIKKHPPMIKRAGVLLKRFLDTYYLQLMLMLLFKQLRFCMAHHIFARLLLG